MSGAAASGAAAAGAGAGAGLALTEAERRVVLQMRAAAPPPRQGCWHSQDSAAAAVTVATGGAVMVTVKADSHLVGAAVSHHPAAFLSCIPAPLAAALVPICLTVRSHEASSCDDRCLDVQSALREPEVS